MALANPQPGDEITADWGQQVTKAINDRLGIQSGTVVVAGITSSVNGSTTVTFPKPFVGTPVITVGSPSTQVGVSVATITPTSFAMVARRWDGSGTAYTGTFHWIAIGTLA